MKRCSWRISSGVVSLLVVACTSSQAPSSGSGGASAGTGGGGAGPLLDGGDLNPGACEPGPPSPSTGGPCLPQGYATTSLPADAPDGSISLQGASCTRINVVCFTADSTPSSPRACICETDGHLHCSALSSPRTNTGVPTPYN